MRKTLIVLLCAFGFIGIEPAAASAPNINREVAAALRVAHHADAVATRALAASKRLPALVKGDSGAPGSRGADGQSGTPGPSGSNGAGGIAGSAGAVGSTGDRGSKGDSGTPGAPGAGGVKAYGHVTATGTGTTTQGTTGTHPGSGLYCMVDQGFIAVVATPDSYNAAVFALPPGAPNGSCGQSAWTIVVSNNSGVDTGFYFIAN